MRRSKTRVYRVSPPPEGDGPAARLDPEFLSLTIDTSLLLGGNWWGASKGLSGGVSVDTAGPLDLGDERLLAYARALAPAMLRIGGTEADHVRYKSGAKAALELGIPAARTEGEAAADPGEVPGRGLTLGKGAWKRVHKFLADSGFRLLFTVAAGPSERDGTGAWNCENLARLAAYSAKKGLPVAAWELGNEVNAFPFVYGRGSGVGVSQYGRDFARFGNLLRELSPGSLLVGPASAVWPRIGEPYPLVPRIASGPAAGFIDAVSWHYYPQQSSRGRVAVRRAGPGTMLSPKNLDEILRRGGKFLRAARRIDRCKPAHRRTACWLTETAHALYGGEPGVSDTFASTLWWLDELALLAREGVSRVFRQSLVGSDYGLLREGNFEPTPDYFASLLWKRLMGPEALVPVPFPRPDPLLRLYAHRGPAGLSFLAINLDGARPATVIVDRTPAIRCLLTGTDGLLSKTLSVNGVPAGDDLAFRFGEEAVTERYRLAKFDEREETGVFEVAPLGILILADTK